MLIKSQAKADDNKKEGGGEGGGEEEEEGGEEKRKMKIKRDLTWDFYFESMYVGRGE